MYNIHVKKKIKKRGTLHRDFSKENYSEENIIIVTHGITIRCLLMRWFKWDVKYFHTLWNFRNCEHVILEKQENGKHKITTQFKMDYTNYIPNKDFKIELNKEIIFI